MDSRQTLLTRIDRLTRQARAYLTWERFAPVLALGIGAALIFIAGSFAGLWERIGDPWRLIALLIALALLFRSIWYAAKLKLPAQNEARRRVERDSALEHRPFDVVRDAAAKTPNSDIDLWDSHSQRAAHAAASASPARLRPALAKIDKFYLRFAIPAILLLTAFVGMGDNTERLRVALNPSWLSASNGQNAKFDAWIDPPDYTGRPAVYFKGASVLDAPDGAEFVARVSGVRSVPRLRLMENGRARRVTLTRLGPQSFEARATLSADSRGQETVARWRIGTRSQEWRMNVVPDATPEVSWEGEPEADNRDQLNMSYNLTDDYGVKSLKIELRLYDSAENTPDAPREYIPIPLSSEAVRLAEGVNAKLNLTKHKWAGKKTYARLVATDALEQKGYSQALELIVPDKIFIDPLAKAIVENRALLLEGAQQAYAPVPELDWRAYPRYSAPLPELRINRAPATVQRAAVLLGAITDSPVGAYKDPVVFMGLKNVQSRVEQARETEDLHDAPEDLWLIAMRAEFGPLGNAREAMQAAEAALNAGIARRARKREIDALFQRYNDAVDRYMEFLMEEARNSGQDPMEGGGGGEGGRNVDEIQALLDAIEEANRLGDTEGARRALAQLAELLENMQIQLTQGSGGEGEGMPSDGLSDEVKEAIEDLADTLGDQRELNDETRQAQREQEQQGQQQGQQQSGQNGSQNSNNGSPQSGQNGDHQTPNENDQSERQMAEIDPEQLARDQAALLNALSDLEHALADSDADMDAAAEGEDGENGAGSEQTTQGTGSGGEPDENGEGRGAGGDETGEQASISPQEAIDAARQAMEDAQNALRNGDLENADEAQRAAIDALREAASSLISQARMENGEQSEGADGNQAGDPFGREEGDGEGIGEGGDTDVPFISDRQRARELIDELRERAGEQNRSQEELDYLERLLERF